MTSSAPASTPSPDRWPAIVGGIVWLPFLVAFIVATMTALSYLELVTKYPQAAGAALYTHKAFGIHFVTFLVAFAVICSGITSASTSANVLAQNLTGGLVANGWMDELPSTGVVTAIAMAFMILLALINLRGVGESVKFNVVLTLVEMTALSIVILIGFYAMTQGEGDISRVTTFEGADDKGLFLAVTAATSVAFFAMVGFEDSVNMVEEVQEPQKIFPRTMLTGLGVAVIIYMLVAVAVVTVLTPSELATINETEGRALPRGRRQGSPRPPDGPHLPVPGGLRGRQHRPDQHADGQPAALRHGPAGRPAAVAGQGVAQQPRAVRRHRLLHPARARPHLVRRHPVGLLDRRSPVRARPRCSCSRSSPWSTWPA